MAKPFWRPVPKYILITRPEPDATALAARLKIQNYATLCEPMLQIAPLPEQAEALHKTLTHKIQALVATSANGVRAFAALSPERGIPFFAVGNMTQAAAQEAGFQTIHTAGGDVESLAKLCIERLDPKDGKILYLSGTTTSKDLIGTLTEHGLKSMRIALYDAVAVPAFSEKLLHALAHHRITSALFYSSRTSRVFLECARRADLLSSLSQVHVCAFSQQIAGELSGVTWKALHIADAPNEEAMIRLLATIPEIAPH